MGGDVIATNLSSSPSLPKTQSSFGHAQRGRRRPAADTKGAGGCVLFYYNKGMIMMGILKGLYKDREKKREFKLAGVPEHPYIATWSGRGNISPRPPPSSAGAPFRVRPSQSITLRTKGARLADAPSMFCNCWKYDSCCCWSFGGDPELLLLLPFLFCCF